MWLSSKYLTFCGSDPYLFCQFAGGKVGFLLGHPPGKPPPLRPRVRMIFPSFGVIKTDWELLGEG